MGKKVHWRAVDRAAPTADGLLSVTLRCGHSRLFRPFRDNRVPLRLGCGQCGNVLATRLAIAPLASGYDPELVRIFQGEWVNDAPEGGGIPRSVTAVTLSVACDRLEECSDARAGTVRAVLKGFPRRSYYFLAAFLVDVLPELRWAWYSDPTLWPFPDMER